MKRNRSLDPLETLPEFWAQTSTRKTQNKKEAFNAIKQLFARGQKEIYVYGGKIGSWR